MPAGSDGLLFLPYLTGERSPHPDPLARGAFVGLTVRHERRHLTRAVLEGVAFGLRDGLDLMVAAGVPAPSQIRASGGGTASAAVAPDPRRRPRRRDRHGSARPKAPPTARRCSPRSGPAGSRTSRAPRQRGSTATPVAAPGPGCRARTPSAHALYRGLYPALAPTFRELQSGA